MQLKINFIFFDILSLLGLFSIQEETLLWEAQKVKPLEIQTSGYAIKASTFGR